MFVFVIDVQAYTVGCATESLNPEPESKNLVLSGEKAKVV